MVAAQAHAVARVELRTALTWKEDVEAALERLLGSVTIHTSEPILRPA